MLAKMRNSEFWCKFEEKGESVESATRRQPTDEDGVKKLLECYET